MVRTDPLGGARAPGDRAADVLAGLSVAGLLVPEAVAYSSLANLPPAAGVIGLLAGLICYALVGRSRFAIVSPTSSSAAVLAAAITALGAATAAQRVAWASLLVCGTGVAFLLAGAARLGALSNLIARPVLRGFSFGLALVIVVKQGPHILGLHAQATDFFALLAEMARRSSEWRPAVWITGVGALAALFLLGIGRTSRVPGVLLVIVAGVAAAPWLAAHGVVLAGPIELSLGAPSFLRPSDRQWLPLTEFSLALMFILFAESYGSIRTFALKHDDAVQPSRDLWALGLANVVSGLLHGNPVGAGYSGTSANEAAGAGSRASGLVAAAAVLALVSLLRPWIARIPDPILAAVVIHAVSKSLRLAAFRPYFAWRRDRLIAIISVAAVLVFGMLDGLLAAIAFSLAMLLHSLSSPRLSVLGRLGGHDFVSVDRFAEAERLAQILVLRPEEPLFFANADPLLGLARKRVLAQPGVRQVVLSLEESPDLDGTSLESLGEMAAWLAARGMGLRLARLKDASRDALIRAAIPQLPAAELDYASVDDAVLASCAAFEPGADALSAASPPPAPARP